MSKKAKCTQCGKEERGYLLILGYSPSGYKPLYCEECYSKLREVQEENKRVIKEKLDE